MSQMMQDVHPHHLALIALHDLRLCMLAMLLLLLSAPPSSTHLLPRSNQDYPDFMFAEK